MANNTTINGDLFTNLLAEAQFAAYETSVARQIVTAFDYPANAGSTLQVPVYSSVSAVSLSEGVAPSSADTATSSASITLGEIGTYFEVTDFLRDSAERDVIADLGFNAGRAIAEKMDQDVFALFDNFNNEVGTEDSDISVDDIFQAVATLRQNKIVGPLFAVVGPFQALQLKKELATAGGANITASEIGSSVLREYFIGSLAGCQIFESSLVDQTIEGETSSDLNTVGAVFAPTAIGHAMRGGINMETQRQAAKRAEDIMMTAVKGEVILQNPHGVKIVGANPL